MKKSPSDIRRTCWLYDFLLTRGGAEEVTRQVAQTWPQLDVRVATINKALFEVEASGISFISRRSPYRQPLPRAFQTERIFRRWAGALANYDEVVFSGMFAPLAILKQAANHSIYYAHTTPLPFAFDWQQAYLQALPTGPARALFKRYSRRQRVLYTESMSRMERVIANSQFVASRYEYHFGFTPEVIYPPVDISGFEWISAGNEFVTVSTLARHKRIDLAIEAFAGMPGQTLRIIGDGPELKRLRTMAFGLQNIKFEGSCNRKKVQAIMGKCRAVICVSRDEHFGLVVIEAMAAGKPVIAVSEGSHKELIIDGVTGKLIPAEIEALQSTILEMTTERAFDYKENCQRNAPNFSPGKFFRSMGNVLSNQSTA